jgi:MFS transporter, DHA2 family, methylenomycin A resistance protein
LPSRRCGFSKASALILATALGFVLVQLDVSIVNVALVSIGHDLHSSVAGLQWIVDAYAITFASLLLAGGALGDRFGARKIFVVGFVLFAIGSLLCGVAPTTGVLVFARVFQGVGAALLIPCSLALINHAYAPDPKKRAQAIGLWTAAGSAALAAGPVIGGLLVGSVGWRFIFFVNVPLAVVGIWTTLAAVEETQPGKGVFDWGGQILAIVALAALIEAVINGGSSSWASPYVLGGFAIGAACAVAFVALEKRLKAPMLPLEFFARRPFSVATIVGLAINFSLYGVLFILALFFQHSLAYTPLMTGLAFLPSCIVLGGANLIAGRVVGKYGVRLPMAAGLAIAAFGYAALAAVDTHTPFVAMLPGLLMFPLGLGLAVPAMTTALIASVEKKSSGVASGVLNTVRQAAGALGVALFGGLFAAGGVAGMHVSFVISAVLIAAAAAIAASLTSVPAAQSVSEVVIDRNRRVV